jgi:hypothetical protein
MKLFIKQYQTLFIIFDLILNGTILKWSIFISMSVNLSIDLIVMLFFDHNK